MMVPRASQSLVDAAMRGPRHAGEAWRAWGFFVAVYFGLRLVFERRVHELDVVFGEATNQLQPIRRVRRRRLVELFEPLDLADEQAASAVPTGPLKDAVARVESDYSGRVEMNPAPKFYVGPEKLIDRKADAQPIPADLAPPSEKGGE